MKPEYKLIKFRASELVLKSKQLEELIDDLESYRTDYIKFTLPKILSSVDECINEILVSCQQNNND